MFKGLVGNKDGGKDRRNKMLKPIFQNSLNKCSNHSLKGNCDIFRFPDCYRILIFKSPLQGTWVANIYTLFRMETAKLWLLMDMSYVFKYVTTSFVNSHCLIHVSRAKSRINVFILEASITTRDISSKYFFTSSVWRVRSQYMWQLRLQVL